MFLLKRFHLPFGRRKNRFARVLVAHDGHLQDQVSGWMLFGDRHQTDRLEVGHLIANAVAAICVRMSALGRLKYSTTGLALGISICGPVGNLCRVDGFR